MPSEFSHACTRMRKATVQCAAQRFGCHTSQEHIRGTSGLMSSYHCQCCPKNITSTVTTPWSWQEPTKHVLVLPEICNQWRIFDLTWLLLLRFWSIILSNQAEHENLENKTTALCCSKSRGTGTGLVVTGVTALFSDLWKVMHISVQDKNDQPEIVF